MADGLRGLVLVCCVYFFTLACEKDGKKRKGALSE